MIKLAGAKLRRTTDLRAKHLDSENIQRLPSDILRAHIDDAFHTKFCTNSSSCNTMLACSCFRDDTGFSKAPGK